MMLKTAIRAAKKAGIIISEHYGDIAVDFKKDNYDSSSIVTIADVESERKIVEVLKEEFPEHNYLGEEEIDEDNGSEYTWVIDPLDGTSNFSRNIPLFGVSIGLLKDDEPILGVLHFPELELTIHAEKGKGAFANEERLNVSERQLERSLYYASGYRDGKFRLVESVASKVSLVKIVSASSYEFASLAMGDGEIRILESVLHDVAAGVVIVREAGGKVTDENGRKWTPDSDSIVVTNGVVHSEVIDILSGEEEKPSHWGQS